MDALNVVRGGLPCFTVFKTVEKEMIFDSVAPPQIQMGFIISLKPCLNLRSLRWLKPRRNLINSFIYHMGYKYRK